jgi:hypothetical protein
MAITISELPNADYNKKLRLWITSNHSYLAHCVAEFIDAEGLSRIKSPVIFLQDMETNRTKKTTLEDFIAHLGARIESNTSSNEPLQEALQLLYQISLVGRLPDTLQQELESFLWRHYDRE